MTWQHSCTRHAVRMLCLTALDHYVQVEFNKAALSLSDALPGDKKAAMNRLLKVAHLRLAQQLHAGRWQNQQY